MVVAYVATARDAAVAFLGPIGTRHWAIDHLLRTRPSKAEHLIVVWEAGPCGDCRSRSLTQPGFDCWAIAPTLIPPTPGDRVNTARRDAVPWARLARAGDPTMVYGPQMAAEAMRELARAREDTLGSVQERVADTRAEAQAGARRTHVRWPPTHGIPVT
jgi:transposase